MARLVRNKNGDIVRMRSNAQKKKKEDENKKFMSMLDSLTTTQLKKILIDTRQKLDAQSENAFCVLCDSQKPRSDFYPSTDPLNIAGICPVCKECARKVALRTDADGVENDPTKESVQLALRYLNKPFVEKVWEQAVRASQSMTGNAVTTAWGNYMRTISMRQYADMTYFDSDFYHIQESLNSDQVDESLDNKEVVDSFQQNKEDAIRLLGYDPFAKESLGDQPFLYANLIGYLDASSEANEDRMRISSIIEIVKGFNHIEKLNDIIARLLADVGNLDRNVATIRNLEDTKNKITTSVLNLAKDNGISLKHSVNASKGENTWTGKVRKMKEMDLRDAEMNLYDTEYSAGLQQVAEISDAAIIKQIRLDENDQNDMIIQQRELINKYKKIADDCEEKARILLRENGDLKDRLKELENGN